MPGGVNSQALAERLKARCPESKVLFISGYTDEAIVPHSALEPRLFLLQKPLAPNIPLGKVRRF
jgi:hypothetical protein